MRWIDKIHRKEGVQTSPRKGKKKSKEREREEEEGNGDNEDRVRHVPEALAVSLSRREPTAAGLLPLPGRMQTRVQMLLHTWATRLHAAAGPAGEAARNKGKKKPSSNELLLCLWFLLVVRRVQSREPNVEYEIFNDTTYFHYSFVPIANF